MSKQKGWDASCPGCSIHPGTYPGTTVQQCRHQPTYTQPEHVRLQPTQANSAVSCPPVGLKGSWFSDFSPTVPQSTPVATSSESLFLLMSQQHPDSSAAGICSRRPGSGRAEAVGVSLPSLLLPKQHLVWGRPQRLWRRGGEHRVTDGILTGL